MNNISFKLTDSQLKTYAEWRKTIPKMKEGAIGGAYTFCFTPTGIGTVVEVKHFSGEKLDLSKYENNRKKSLTDSLINATIAP